jgi:Flp pilus assembly pilin Flp
MGTMSSLVCNERGAEMVEYVIVVAILALAGLTCLALGAFCIHALTTGVQTVADIVTNVSGA